jgi:hypothetical protein
LPEVRAALQRGDIDYQTAFRESALLRERAPTGLDPAAARLRKGWETAPGLAGRMMAGELTGQRIEAESRAAAIEREAKAEEEQRAIRAADDAAQRIAAEQTQRTRALYDQAWAERMAQYDAAARDLERQTIDPDRAFGDSKTARTINRSLSMIALGLAAAFGQRGSVEAVAEQINKAIDRDIEIQKAAIDNKRASLAAKTGAFSLLRAKLGDDAAAEALARSQMLGQTERRLERIRSQLKTDQQRAAVGQVLDAMRRQREQAVMGLRLQAQQQAAARAASANWAAQQPRADVRPATPADEARYVPGLQGFAATEKEAAELKGAMAATKTYVDQIERLAELNRQGAVGPLAPERGEAEKIIASATYAAGQMAGTGVMSDKEQGMFAPPAVYDLTKSDERIARELQTLKAMAESRLNNRIRAANITPGAMATGTDARGRPQRQMTLGPVARVVGAPGEAPRGGTAAFTPGPAKE